MPDSAIPWVIVHQVPPSIGFSRQGYWSGLPFPSPRGLADLGIKLGSPALQADSLPGELPGKHCMEHNLLVVFIIVGLEHIPLLFLLTHSVMSRLFATPWTAA